MIPYINTPFEPIARLLGFSADELKLIFTFFLSYPLAAVLKRIPDNSPTLKNVFNIGIALFYLVGLFDLWSGLATIIIDSTVTYLIAAYINGPYMPWVGFVYLMGHMSVSHIIREFITNEPATVDITGAQMVMVMKLSSFCWHVWDGKQKQSELSEEQKGRALTALPPLLDYAGFVAFFPSLMIGPAFDYIDYHRWLTTTMFDLPAGTDPMRAPPTRKKRRIPRSATPAMLKMATGLVWVMLFAQFSQWYNAGIVLSDNFTNFGFARRVYHLYMMSFVQRFKYYGVWTLTEGACILSGIGFNGIDPKSGKAKWDRLTNIRPLGVELAQNTHAYLGNWNINTNNWLRNSVYLRVTPKGKKPGFRASLATFTTSAFWHGFEPGYYLSFVLASFIQNVAKNCRRLIRPFFLKPDGKTPTPYKPYYDVATWFITQLTFSFTTAPFILLGIHDCLLAWQRVYFYAIFGVLGCSIFLVTPGKMYLQRRVAARSSRPTVHREVSQESMGGPTLGVPSEPGREFDEMVDEIMDEVKRRRGSKVGPDGQELRRLVEQTLGKEVDAQAKQE